MTSFSLVVLPADHLKALAAQRPAPAGGGNATERNLALACALVAIAAAAVLGFVG